MTQPTTEHPTTTPEAAKQGWLFSPTNYNGKMELSRFRRHCRQSDQPVIHVCPRKSYSSLELELPEGRELSPKLAMMILRERKRHKSPGRVTIDYALLEKLPIDAAVSLAREFVAMTTT